MFLVFIFSFCKEHKWKRRKFNPHKKSVFALKQQQETAKKQGDNFLEVVGVGEGIPKAAVPEVTLEEDEEDAQLADEDYASVEQDDADDGTVTSSDEEGDDQDMGDNSGSEDGTEDEDEDINALPENMEELECQSSMSIASTSGQRGPDSNSNALGDQNNPGNRYSGMDERADDKHIRRPTEIEMEMRRCILDEKSSKRGMEVADVDSVFSTTARNRLYGNQMTRTEGALASSPAHPRASRSDCIDHSGAK